MLAIVALLGGRYFGWTFLDASMGIVGGLVISKWSYGLCRHAAKQLLDVVPSEALVRRIRERIESTFPGASVVELHLWDIGPNARACIVSVAAARSEPPAAYRNALDAISLQHVTVEVHPLVTWRRPIGSMGCSAVIPRTRACEGYSNRRFAFPDCDAAEQFPRHQFGGLGASTAGWLWFVRLHLLELGCTICSACCSSVLATPESLALI